MAHMTGSGDGLWTLAVLLLPLFLCLSSASAIPRCMRWSQFQILSSELQNNVTCCPQECNSPRIERKCKYLNINITECVFPAYFILGLEALKFNLPESYGPINQLISKLRFTFTNCTIKRDSLPLDCKINPISPKAFLETLENVINFIRSSR